MASHSDETRLNSRFEGAAVPEWLWILEDVAGEFVQTCTTPAQARHLIDRAMWTAAARRCGTAIIFPNHVQEADAVATPEHAHGTVHSSASFSQPSIVPVDEDLTRAADILNRGEKVAMLVGAGAAGAMQEVIDVADRLQAGVAKALLGKSVLSDDIPFVTGRWACWAPRRRSSSCRNATRC